MASHRLLPERDTLARALAPWRAQIRRQHVLSGTLGGLVLATALAALTDLAARVIPLAVWPVGAAAVVVLSLAAGALAGFLRAPSLYQTARRVDRRLDLADRLATGWEATGEGWPLAHLQAADALAHLARHDPGRDLPLRLPTRALKALAAALAAVLVLWALPNPMDEVLRQQDEARARVAEAAERVKEAEKLAAEALALSPEERRAIQEALERLERDLARAGSEREALAALSAAEDHLSQLNDPAAREKAATLSNLARALAGNERTARAGEAIGRADPETTRQALAQLGRSLSQLDPEERRRLAQTLQAAANEAANSGRAQAGLSGKLRETARAVAVGDDAAGATALGQVADEVSALQEAVAEQEQRARVGGAIRAARGAVTGATSADQAAAGNTGLNQGVTPEQLGQAAAKPGAGTGSGEGQGDGAGRGTGQNAGQGQVAGQGQGQGSAAGQAVGSSGQQGSGGGRGGREGGTATGGPTLGDETGELQGGGERLFIPGQEGAGPSQQTPFDTQPTAGSFRPYQEVIGHYAQSAREHLERSAIPPALKETVRQYFSGLEDR